MHKRWFPVLLSRHVDLHIRVPSNSTGNQECAPTQRHRCSGVNLIVCFFFIFVQLDIGSSLKWRGDTHVVEFQSTMERPYQYELFVNDVIGWWKRRTRNCYKDFTEQMKLVSCDLAYPTGKVYTTNQNVAVNNIWSYHNCAYVPELYFYCHLMYV